MYRNLGFADGLGYGFCRDHAPKNANEYTPEKDERCERCGRIIISVPDGKDNSGTSESTPCRIF